jgi:CBS domain containing-hemolysin-like protein
MIPLIVLLPVLFFLVAVFSGAETGVYVVSRVRLDAEAREGKAAARLLKQLLRDDTGLLITLIVAYNLLLEVVTFLVESRVSTWRSIAPWATELVAALALTPVIFIVCELFPKDLFRRRPHLFLRLSLPLLSGARIALLPLVVPIQWLSALVEAALGVQEREFARALGREDVVDLLSQGKHEGSLAPGIARLAENVLVLRDVPVTRVMVRWDEVVKADLTAGEAPALDAIREASFTRIPLVGPRPGGGKGVLGYVLQLDLFLSESERSLAELVRPIQVLAPGLSVDQAMHRMRSTSERLALVGTPEKPVGVVTLMDLVDTIARVERPRSPSPRPGTPLG